jgi:hypothetical protein
LSFCSTPWTARLLGITPRWDCGEGKVRNDNSYLPGREANCSGGEKIKKGEKEKNNE